MEMLELQATSPTLPNDPIVMSNEKVALHVNEAQLWDICMGLERLKLIPKLQKATQAMAKEIHKFGKKHYKWT